MKKIIICFLLLLPVIFGSVNAFGSKDTFSQRMASIVQKAEKGNEVIGVEVVSLNDGDLLYSHNGLTNLNPASCTKIVTTAAALKLLGTNFRFHTNFYADHRPIKGKIGKLWVKGSGDPSIVIENLWRMARDISNTGLTEIDGDIIIDDHYFEGYKYPGYAENSGRAFNSLTGAVSLNFNGVTIVVAPGSSVGEPPYVTPDTAGPYFRIVNMAKTGSAGSKKTISAVRKSKDGEDEIVVSGNIPADSAPVHIYRNITNPPIYFGLALKSLLQQNGVKVNGNVVSGYFPGGGYLVLDSVSKPLSLIVRDMNKFSNNFIAEQILKVLGAEIASPPGTTKKGLEVVDNFLAHIGIPKKSYTIVNGSGLTHENKISASALVKALSYMFSDPRIAPEAMASLSIAGTDGTIKSRHKSPKLNGLVRAKTGTLNGVSTLAGIVPADSGEMLGFAILMNGNGVGWDKSHKIQEDMLNAMASFGRN